MVKTIKNRVGCFWRDSSKLEKCFFGLVFLLTVFRFLLAMKIPLHIQAGAVYDDRMLVNYSTDLLAGRWLGGFDKFSLAKGASYSLFLAINYLFGLPYSFTLIFLYMVAVAVFCLALYKLIINKGFMCVLYSIMLYSPVMFHDENVQKVYRGGVIVIFALFVVAAMIGVYTRIEERNRKILCWSVLATVSLVFFWFLKEDSIWVLPFVCGSILLAIIRIFRMSAPKRMKWKKAVLVVLPLAGLVVGIIGYKTVNYVAYGEYAVTDRQGTYFKEVISDLIHIEGEARSKDNWVTRDMLEKAYAVSPTLAQVKDEVNKGYEGWAKEDGEIEGDIIFWAIKDAVAEAGLYENGRMVNEFYRDVHNELSLAFEEGRLERNHDFYISAVAKGINSDEMPEFMEHMGRSMNNVVTYEYNETGVYAATGDRAGITLFNKITMSQYADPESDGSINRPAELATEIAEKIVAMYRATGGVLFYGAMVVFALYTGYVVYRVCRKMVSERALSLYLVVLGLITTCFTLFLGTTFFCRFLSQKKVYDYASPMLPMSLAVEVTLIYVLIVGIKCIIRKWRNNGKREKKNIGCGAEL